MGYESLSTVVVLVIIGIVMTIWLPRRTVNGMKQAEKHRADRYSTSLHLVDEGSGTRFSDEHTPRAKGAIMPTPQTNRENSREYIAYVRGLRRAAARRRAWLAGGLIAATVIVAVLAVVLHFSPWFAVIPAALLAAVLILGHRASQQAQAWEAKVAQRERERKRKQGRGQTSRQSSHASQQAGHGASPSNSVAQDKRAHEEEDTSTAVLEQREIRRVLHEGRKEQQQALARRAAQEMQAREAAQRAQEAAAAARATQQQSQAATQSPTGAQTVSSDHAQLVVRAEANTYVLDETNELSTVEPSDAVDAFDMAVNQDLISFSLGSPRNGVEVPSQAPESLEIKSTRQVAKAEPKQPIQEPQEDVVPVKGEEVAASAQTQPSSQSSSAQPTPSAKGIKTPKAARTTAVNDTAAFHETEAAATVEAPDETSDSLGASLDSILARRGN